VARTLRDRGFPGDVILVGDEPHPPYERPPLSKDVLLGLKQPKTTYLATFEGFGGTAYHLMLGIRFAKSTGQPRPSFSKTRERCDTTHS